MAPVIADLYTPLLALGVLFMLLKSAQFRFWLPAAAFSTLMIFAFSALESRLGFWRSWGLDYSTHTAVLLPLFQLLCVLLWQAVRAPEPLLKSWGIGSALLLRLLMLVALALAVSSALGYFILMEHLGYHSPADILTTVVSSYPLVWICFYLLSNRKPLAGSQNGFS